MQANEKINIMNWLYRLFLVATMSCGFLGSRMEAWGKDLSNGDQEHEEQIGQNDGGLRPVAEEPQTSSGTLVLSVPSTNRVVSSRSIRLIPTHGGKSNKPAGRWTKGNFNNAPLFPTLLSSRYHCCRRMAGTSPRLRYVIALRHLLC